MSMFELSAQYDSTKSFYGKARVETSDDERYMTLYSYATPVCKLDRETGKYKVDTNALTNTSTRHVREFLRQFAGLPRMTKQQIVSGSN